MMAFTNLIGMVGLAGLAIFSVKSYLKKFDSNHKTNDFQR